MVRQIDSYALPHRNSIISATRGSPPSRGGTLAHSRLAGGLLIMILVALAFVGNEISNAESSDNWVGWANTAWKYFQPEIGVNSNTGLHYATSGWHRFTDWDLGVYIEAMIDAEKLGILGRDGTWGANYRLDKILGFLESRQLSSDGLPFAQYDAETGHVPSDIGTRTAHPSDCGRLLLSLDDLRVFRPDLTARIGSLVARHNFQALAESSYFAGNDIYPVYLAQGYHAFGFSTPRLRSVESLGGGSYVSVYGESLPKAWVTTEPLLSAILENRSVHVRYRTYSDRVFSAHQKRYEATGNLTAFSEGSYWGPYYYVYEWVVNALGETWTVYASEKIHAVPLVYSKIAFAFHAIYHNQYTNLLVSQLSPLQSSSPSGGYYEGKSEEGATLSVLSDKTNGMILAAARYYLTHESQPTFELSFQPSSLSVIKGGNSTLFVQLTPIGGFGDPVTLTVMDVPSGVSCQLGQSQATPPATVSLQVTASIEMSVGTYEIGVSGVSSSVSKQSLATLTIRSTTSTTIQLSTHTANVSEAVEILGSAQPPRTATIVFLVSFNGSTWTPLTTVNSHENGTFRTEFSPLEPGAYMIKAQAAESEYYLSSESEPVTVTAVSEFSSVFVLAIALSVAVVSTTFLRERS